ncbi:MAG: hypothetical protein AB7P50_22630 [Alphaproteobacteria bacterium]
MFIWRTLDKGAVASLLRAMAERNAEDARRGNTYKPSVPKAEAEIVALPVSAKPR